MKERNIIFNGVFGSHLYGLSTPSSDEDFKGVYLPTKKELIFNQYKPSIEIQTDEVDTSLYAITKFAEMLGKGDTVSFDCLHTPKEFTITTSPLWEQIVSLKEDVYCKNLRGILGYIKTQAFKYAHKQERYKEMTELLGLLSYYDKDTKTADTALPEIVSRSGFKYISYTPTKGSVTGNIDVCGSRYQLTAAISYLEDGVSKKIERYGKRTEKGLDTGGDFKSLSHAVRVLLELEEIIDTRNLVFPLKSREFVLDIKLGGKTQDFVMGWLTENYDRVMEKLESSDLPEDCDMTRIENVILNHVG